MLLRQLRNLAHRSAVAASGSRILPIRRFGTGKQQGSNDNDKAQQSQPKEQSQKTSESQSKPDDSSETNPMSPFIRQIFSSKGDYNPQKELIRAHKEYQKNQKELRSAILFEDLLKSQINIVIYDTKGKPFTKQLMKLLYFVLFCGSGIFLMEYFMMSDKKERLIMQNTKKGRLIYNLMYIFASLLLFQRIFMYRSFQKFFVEKIVYNTKTQNFTFYQRKWYGAMRKYEINRFKIMYTENPEINKMGINYFEIDNMKMFSVGYRDSWIKEDLYSHLILQRIRV